MSVLGDARGEAAAALASGLLEAAETAYGAGCLLDPGALLTVSLLASVPWLVSSARATHLQPCIWSLSCIKDVTLLDVLWDSLRACTPGGM